MRRNLFRHQSGFSLIEIVFVLAISGLIIGLVFIALPQGQKTRRDEQRKLYVQQIAANVEKYKEAAINNFKYPVDSATFDTAFDPSLGTPGPYAVTAGTNDPLSHTPYVFGTAQTPTSASAAGIVYTPDVTCAGATVGSGGSSVYNVTTTLESGATFCVDNH